MADDVSVLTELLQGEAWVNKNALFNRSSFGDSDEFTAWIKRQVNAGKAQIRSGAFGIEVALTGTPAPDDSRAEARGPSAPPGAGPMPPALAAPAALLEAPVRMRGRQAEAPADRQPAAALPSPENAHQPRSEAGQALAAIEQARAAPDPESTSAAHTHACHDGAVTTAPEPAAPITATAPEPGAEEVTMPKIEPTALVLQLLRDAPYRLSDLAAAAGIKPEVLKPLLKSLRDEKLVRLDGVGRAATWHIGKPAKAAKAPAKARENPKSAEAPTDIDVALDQLESRLRPREIKHLEVKLAVLDRLSALFDDTIAAVLGEIRADLAQ